VPGSPTSFLGGILDVEASHLAVSKAEDVFNRLVLQPVRLALKWLAFEIVDGLPNLCDDCVVSSPVEAYRFDVRADHGPLAGPVLAHGLATVNVAAIHAVGPSDIIGKRGQHAIDIPRVEAVVHAFKDFDITLHRALSLVVPVLRQGTEAIYICTYVSEGRTVQARNLKDMDVLSTPGHLISLAARGFARLSEARLKPLGFGVGHLPVLVALRDDRASTQRDLARFAKIEQPPMAQMLARMERDGLIQRTPDPADGRSSRVSMTQAAEARLPSAVAVLLRGNREALSGFTDEEAAQLVALLTRLIANLDRIASVEASPRALS
jgi:MarR family transcriptional regulator, transcriptional regulator for hemolysin